MRQIEISWGDCPCLKAQISYLNWISSWKFFFQFVKYFDRIASIPSLASITKKIAERILKVVTTYSEEVLIIKTEYFKSKVTPAFDFFQPCLFQLHQLSNFFSMGDNSNILFPSMGFSYLDNSKNNFRHLGGSQWAPGGLLGHFRAKTGFFEQF